MATVLRKAYDPKFLREHKSYKFKSYMEQIRILLIKSEFRRTIKRLCNHEVASSVDIVSKIMKTTEEGIDYGKLRNTRAWRGIICILIYKNCNNYCTIGHNSSYVIQKK